MNLRKERGTRALQRLERERAREIGGLREPTGAHEAEREERGHELRPVDERQALFRLEPDRLEPDSRERLESRQTLAVDERLTFAYEREREMGERGEIARRSDRAATRHHGHDSTPEAVEQELDGLDPRAGASLRKRVRAEEHRRAHDLVRVRVADTARVRAEQAKLQLLGQLLGNRAVDEAAEARVDAVRVLTASVRRAFHELSSRAHLVARRAREADRHAVDGDRPYVRDHQVVTREADRGALRH